MNLETEEDVECVDCGVGVERFGKEKGRGVKGMGDPRMPTESEVEEHN